ncbi:MAG TPA: delta-60 repeat domain-containing protein, partial [Pyrinomonadaceae bacterium]|nr:delta-60 repeat domain-containing protein [Pyrinomonadaceae bacterium]
MKFSIPRSKFFAFPVIFAAFLIFQTHALAAGVLDPAFGTNGRTTASVGNSARSAAIVVQPDGKIIVVGDIVRDATGRDIALARFNPDGTLDSSFGDGGIVRTAISNRNDSANAVALQPDGKIIVAGSTQPFEFPSEDFLLVRFNSNGFLDSSFGTGGIVTVNQAITDRFLAVTVQTDGKIVAAGSTSQNDGEAAILRFNSNGALDQSFANGGLYYQNLPRMTNERFQSIALFPNNRIVVGGISFGANGYEEVIALLESNGSLVRDFGNQGVVQDAVPDVSGVQGGYDLAVMPGNKILTANVFATRRLLNNGAPDPTFNGYS